MDLLLLLTLVYAAVLVVALAASLIAILVYLCRIAAVLGEVHETLEAVSRETDPLESSIQPLHDVAAASAQEIETTQIQLTHANDQLSTLLKRLGVRRQVP